MLRLIVDNTQPNAAPVHEMALPESDVFSLLAVVRELSAYEFHFDETTGAVHLRPSAACDFSAWLAEHGVHAQTPQTIYLPDDRPAA